MEFHLDRAFLKLTCGPPLERTTLNGYCRCCPIQDLLAMNTLRASKRSMIMKQVQHSQIG